MQQNYSNLKSQAISGVKWNVIAQITVYAITLLGTAILSRILPPADFGLYGMLTVIINLANMVVAMGVTLAIIQDQNLNETDISSIFWLNIIIAFTVAITFFISAPLIAKFYGQPELMQIARILSIVFILHGCNAVPVGLLSKEINFRAIAFSQIPASFVSFTLGIVLAYRGFGVYSLVAQVIVLNLITCLINIYNSKWLPSLRIRKESLIKIKYFSFNYLPSQLIDFFASNLDVVIIGKYFGARNVGLYGKAIALVQLPVNLVGLVFNKSFYPVFSKIQNDQRALKHVYLKSSKMMSLVLFPMYMLIIVLSKDVILILFGIQWLEASIIVEILGFFAILHSLNSYNETFLLSQGKADWLLKINVVDKVILIVLFITALKFGVLYFAYAKLLATFFAFLVKFVAASYIHKVSIWRWLNSLKKILGAFIISTSVCILLKSVMIEENQILRFLTASVGSVLTFIFILHVLREHSLKEFKSTIKSTIGR